MALTWQVQTWAETYLFYNAFGGTWQDAEKDWSGDSLMCWAAAASNVLTWGGWAVPQFHNEELIFEEFENRWVNKGDWEEYAMRWWFDGTDPGGGRIDVPGGGNYWSSYTFSNYYKPMKDSANQMQKLDQDLQNGYASILYVTGGGSHVITAWGFDYHYEGGNKIYDAVWVTDSDDGVNALQRYPVSYNSSKSRWDLGGGYAGWHIAGVDGLKANPSPRTAKYDFKYTYGNGDWYSGYVYAPMNYGYNFGAGLEPNYTFYRQDENGKNGVYEITGINTTSSYSSSLRGKVYVTQYYDAESKLTFNVNGYGSNYLGSESGYLYNNSSIPGYRFGDYLYDSIEQIHRNNEADVSFFYRFKFIYQSEDYYLGYGYMDPSKYYLNQAIPRRAEGGWGAYQITEVKNIAYDPAKAGQVWVTQYYDAQSNALLSVTGNGNNYLGSEYGYLYGVTRAPYRFGYTVFKIPFMGTQLSLTMHAEADTPNKYFFTYTYPNGDKYWGYGYAHPDDKFVTGYSAQASAEGGGQGTYEVYETQAYNINPSNVGKVWATKYYDSESNLTITNVSASGTGYMGSEKGYLYGQTVPDYKFGYDFAGYIIYGDIKKPIYYVFEADVGDKYTFKYTYGNGDYYEGSVYRAPGIYYPGWKLTKLNELKKLGFYEITGMSLTNDTAKYGQVFVDLYYDGESSKNYEPLNKGQAVGTAYLGSERDYIVKSKSSDYLFGKGYYEADVGDAFRFRYSYGNNDYYEGVVYQAPSGTYYPGYKLSVLNELGLKGYYEILSMTYTGKTREYGNVYVNSYYDGDRLEPQTFVPLNSTSPLGTNYLKSENGYIIDTRNSNHRFGEGYYEADEL
jgi:hypothetical protein